ncbi:MAG: transcriptional repressor [Candidatus Bathyarchaeia archaeon]
MVGGSYWSVLHSIVHFRERKFTLDDLLKYVHTRERRERIDAGDLPLILKRLEENDLIIKDVKGFYEIPSLSVDALGETFGFIWRPRQGKTGFLKYMLGSEKRVTFWYCLHQRGLLGPEQAQEITGYEIESCKKFMEKFRKQELLTRVEENVYTLGNEQKIHENFQKLYEGYLNYAIRPTDRDVIINIMQGHDKASGKEIHRDLEKMGKALDISGIYRALHGLESEGIVRKTGKTKRVRGTLMRYYELNYEDPQKHTEQLKSMIQEKIRKSELKNSVREEFFKEIVKQKPHVAYVFFKDLDPLVLWYENQIESLTLWEEFIKNLPQDLIDGVITEFSSGKSDEEFKESLAGISRRFRISPLVIAMIYLFEVTTRKKTNV